MGADADGGAGGDAAARRVEVAEGAGEAAHAMERSQGASVRPHLTVSRSSERDRHDGGGRARSRSRSRGRDGHSRRGERERERSRSRSRRGHRKHRDRSPRRRRRSRSRDSRSDGSRGRRSRDTPPTGTTRTGGAPSSFGAPHTTATAHTKLPGAPGATHAPPPLDSAAVAAAKATAAALAAKLAVETQAAAMQNASRKQRELYVGNLAVGIVNAVMLTELFNGALSAVNTVPGAPPPVVKVDMDSTGKFAFVQFATEDMASAALALDKVVLCARPLNVGRPKGYVDPNNASMLFARATLPQGGMLAPGAAAAVGAQAMMAVVQQQQQLQQQQAAILAAGLTCVLLHNIVSCAALADTSPERQDIVEDCRQEAGKFGAVLNVVAPPPPAEALASGAPGRVYIQYADAAGAAACAAGLNGRTFDGNKIATVLVSDDEFRQAQQGVWTQRS